jgi:hypothetical protein
MTGIFVTHFSKDNGSAARSCECDIQNSVSLEGGEFFNWLNDN